MRHHGDLARIEVEDNQLSKILEPKTKILINTKLKELGFNFVTVDLTGYQKGSNNTVLQN